MNKRKFLINEEQKLRLIDMIKKENNDVNALGSLVGAEGDRKVEYPKSDTEEVTGSVESSEIASSFDGNPPKEMLSYIKMLEDAKGYLSKVAAREQDDQIKSKIYAFYDKTQKLISELVREFGLVH